MPPSTAPDPHLLGDFMVSGEVTLGDIEKIYALQTDPASLLMRDPQDPEAIWSIWDNAKQGEKKKILDMARSIVKTGT